jgi:hypothetical protein
MNDYEIKFLTYEYESALKIDSISKQRSTYPQTILIFSTFIHFSILFPVFYHSHYPSFMYTYRSSSSCLLTYLFNLFKNILILLLSKSHLFPSSSIFYESLSLLFIWDIHSFNWFYYFIFFAFTTTLSITKGRIKV